MEDKHQHATTRIREIETKLNKLSYRDANYDSLVNERNNLAVLLESEVGKTEADFRKLMKEPKKLKVETKIIKATKQKKVDRATKYQKKKQEAILVLSDKEEFIRKSLSQKKKLSEIAKCLNVTPAFLEEFLILSEIPYKKIRNIKPNKLDNKVDDILLWYSQKISITEICKRCGVRRRNFVDFVDSRELPITISPKPLSQEKLPKVKKYLKAGLSSEEIAFKFGIRDYILKDFYRKNGINPCDFNKTNLKRNGK